MCTNNTEFQRGYDTGILKSMQKIYSYFTTNGLSDIEAKELVNNIFEFTTKESDAHIAKRYKNSKCHTPLEKEYDHATDTIIKVMITPFPWE